LAAVEVEVTADLAGPKAALGGVLEQADLDHLAVEVEEDVVIEAGQPLADAVLARYVRLALPTSTPTLG
jgi:hypothetical protein